MMKKRRMKPNPHESGYHSREHDEDPTCHAINDRDTQACEPVDYGVEQDTANEP